MRLLTRHIYRAFPELDSYSDEQCRAFVKAARRNKFARARRAAAVSFAGAAVTSIGVVLAAMFSEYSERVHSEWPWRLALIGFLVWMLVVLPGAVLLLRDVLLRLRVRYILRRKGVCHGCQYGLIGLPIGPELTVVCPECGLESKVDESLGELVRDDSGQARYQPAVTHARTPRFLTAARVRKFKRAAKYVGLCVLVGVPLLWGAYEVFLQVQGRAAAKARPGAAGLLAHVESVQTVGENGPNAWREFASADLLLESIDANDWKHAALKTPAGNEYTPDFSLLYSGSSHFRSDVDADTEPAARAKALELLSTYRDKGLWGAMDKITQCERAVRSITLPPTQPMALLVIPELGRVRRMTRINAARMHVAAEAGDLAEFSRALEANLAIARMVGMQPLLIDGLVANACEAMTWARVRAVLSTPRDDQWLRAIEQAMARQQARVSMAYMLEGERLAISDSLGWVFEKPSRVRFGRFSPDVHEFLGATPDLAEFRLGTFAENRAEVDRAFEAASKVAVMERWERPSAIDVGTDESLMIVAGLLPSLTRAVQSRDQILLERRGITVLIALERHRVRHGDYPASLEALVPEFLPEMPNDPWTGAPFGYVRVDPASDSQGRSFLLYSFGADRRDNGGATREGVSDYSSLSDTSNTSDFVINDLSR